MSYNHEMIEELNILACYNLHSNQEGIKVHSSASKDSIAATQRLFDKGLISQADGGYLTSLGITAAEHAQNLLQIIKAS
ncbi:MAG: TIGR02647 family protein [Pseudomonadales bacterium]